MIVTPSSNKANVSHGVFSIPMARYCKELEDVIAVAKSKGYIIPTSYQLRQLNTYINELISNGIWSRLDLFYFFGYGGENSITPALTFGISEPYRKNNLGDFSRLNFINPNRFELVRNTNVATARPSYPYHSKLGWKIGSGGAADNGFLNTNYIIGVDNVRWTQNDASISFYSANFDTTGTANILSGYSDGGVGRSTSVTPSNGTNFLVRINTSGAGANTIANTSSTGYYVSERTASNLTTVYKNGVSIGTTTRLSASLIGTTYPVYILALNSSGISSTEYLRNPISIIKYGSSFGSTLQKVDYELFTNLRIKLGYE